MATRVTRSRSRAGTAASPTSGRATAIDAPAGPGNKPPGGGPSKNPKRSAVDAPVSRASADGGGAGAAKRRRAAASSEDAPEPAEEEEEDDEQFFARLNAFEHRQPEFVDAVARAVGAPKGFTGFDLAPCPVPKGGWETEIVFMLKQGFYPNGTVEFCEDGRTPLHTAVIHRNAAVCKILLDHDADVNLCDNFGDFACEAPLHDVEDETICQWLLDAGAEVNVRGAAGNTPLMMAAARGNGCIARMLLDAGADPTVAVPHGGYHPPWAPFQPGDTAASIARRCGHLALAATLDAAELLHVSLPVNPAVPKASTMQTTEEMVKAIKDGRARKCRIMKRYPPPPLAAAAGAKGKEDGNDEGDAGEASA